MRQVSTLLAEVEFRIGLATGATLAFTTVLIWAVGRGRRGGPAVAVAGAGIAAGYLLALPLAISVGGPWPKGPDAFPLRFGAGIVLLLLAGAACHHLALSCRWLALAGTPGALLLATDSSIPELTWVRVLVAATAAGGGAMAAWTDDRCGRSGLTVVLLPLSLVGLYFTVPDTEEAMVLLGVALPFALLGWPFAVTRLGAGTSASIGCLSWAAAAGGIGRHGAIVGGVGSLGLLLILPLAKALGGEISRPATDGALRRAAVPVTAAVHLGLVFVSSRVAGTRQTGEAAAVIAVPTLVGAAAVSAAVLRRSGRATRHG